MKKFLFLVILAAASIACCSAFCNMFVSTYAYEVNNNDFFSQKFSKQSINDLKLEVEKKNNMVDKKTDWDRKVGSDSLENDQNKQESIYDGVVFSADSLKKTGDFLNVCYTDTYDGDGHGRLHLTLFSKKEADSCCYGCNKIRMELFNSSGEKVLTTGAINKFPEEKGTSQGNSVDIIDKFSIKFGQDYLVLLFDEEKGGKLIGFSFLEVAPSKKSDEIQNYRFSVSEKGSYPQLNVFALGIDGKYRLISDRLKFKFDKVNDGVLTEIDCLSNDNNDDSVFKNHKNLIVEFIDQFGKVINCVETDDTELDSRISVVKTKKLKLPLMTVDDLNSIVELRFYDSTDEKRSDVIAKYKIKTLVGCLNESDVLNSSGVASESDVGNFATVKIDNCLLGPHVFDVSSSYEID